MSMKTRLALVAATTGLALLASGCASAGGNDQSESTPATGGEEALAFCEESEGEVVWYTAAAPGAEEAIVSAWREAYPDIKLQSLRLQGAEAPQRFSSESDAGVFAADVVSLVQPGWAEETLAEGWILSMEEADLPALAEYPSEFIDEAHFVTAVSAITVMYNTNDVTEAPESWDDLLDPTFTGKILLADPRNIPAWLNFFNILYEDPEFGAEYLEALAEQDMTIVQSAVPGSEQVAAGEGATLVFPTVDLVTAPLIAKGAPVAAATFSPATGIETTTVISANAPHPEAARCFANWLASEGGQMAWNGDGRASSPLGNDIKGTVPLPEGYINGDPVAAAANRAAILEALGLD